MPRSRDADVTLADLRIDSDPALDRDGILHSSLEDADLAVGRPFARPIKLEAHGLLAVFRFEPDIFDARFHLEITQADDDRDRDSVYRDEREAQSLAGLGFVLRHGSCRRNGP